MKTRYVRTVSLLSAALLASATPVENRQAQPGTADGTIAPAGPAAKTDNAVVPPSGYVIGVDDVLSVVFWKDKDLSGDVVVRPDGRISLPLINDMQASGLTVDELRANVAAAATKYIEAPAVTVVVRQINSRKAFITGQVAKPGAYPLGDQMTVIQLIALAGGLAEYADKKNIVVIRSSETRPDGTPMTFRVNYDEVLKRRRVSQNIALKAGDTVIVP